MSNESSLNEGIDFKERLELDASNQNILESVKQANILEQLTKKPRFKPSRQKMIDKHRDLYDLSKHSDPVLRRKMGIYDVLVNITNVVISMVNVFILTSLYLDHFEYIDNEYTISAESNTLRWFCAFLSVFCIILIFVRQYFKKKNKRIRFLLHLKDTYPRKELNKVIYLFILFHLIQPYPYAEYYWRREVAGESSVYSLNMILFSLSLLRMTISYDLIKFWYPYTNYTAKRIFKFYHNSHLNLFLYKTAIRVYGFLTLSLLFCVILYIFSLIFKVFEHFDGTDKTGFHYIWNAVWYLVVTMTTIGYGDFTPKTLIGRIIGIFCCICGIFILSLTVVTLMMYTTMNEDELKAYNEIDLAYTKARKSNIFRTYFEQFMKYKMSKMKRTNLAETLILQSKKNILKENILVKIREKTVKPIKLSEFCDKIQEMWSTRLIKVLKNFQEQLQTIANEVKP